MKNNNTQKELSYVDALCLLFLYGFFGGIAVTLLLMFIQWILPTVLSLASLYCILCVGGWNYSNKQKNRRGQW